MTRRHVVNHAKKELAKLEQDYQSSLNERTIKQDLLIDIENLMENLRSRPISQLADSSPSMGSRQGLNQKFTFRIAVLGQTPGRVPHVKSYGKSMYPWDNSNSFGYCRSVGVIQHFSNPANKWLPLFMDLNNENKHEHLTPQTRNEGKQLRIESQGAVFDLGAWGGRPVELGQGAVAQIGDAVIPGHQEFSGEHPATIHGSGTQTVIVWVSLSSIATKRLYFHSLKNAVGQIDRIVNELAAL